MTTVTKLKKILEILEKHGEGDKFVESGHDIIYLSVVDRDCPFAEELIDSGAHYGDSEGWYIYT